MEDNLIPGSEEKVENSSIWVDNHSLNTCRICLEGYDEDKTLIAPCNCAGSVRYAHEECLKLWLLAKNKTMDEAVCEICNEKIHMSYNIKKECLRSHACAEGQKQMAFAISLFILVAMFSGIISMILYKSESGSVSHAYAATITVISALFIISLIPLIVYSIYKAFTKSIMIDWKIIPKKQADEAKETESDKGKV